MPNSFSTQVFRSLDWVLCKSAGIAFETIQFFNKRNPNPSPTPPWTDKPLLKSWEKTKPTLGFPRQTDSLCPACVKEARAAIISGEKDWRDLMHEQVGEIKAQIVERDGQPLGWGLAAQDGGHLVVEYLVGEGSRDLACRTGHSVTTFLSARGREMTDCSPGDHLQPIHMGRPARIMGVDHAQIINPVPR